MPAGWRATIPAMLTRRALMASAIPAVIVFGIFWLWLGFAPWLAGALGLLWGVGSIVVTRAVYDDTDAELAAWREATPDIPDDGGVS